MATAGICNTFDITFSGADLNVKKSITAPRALTIVGIEATNIAAGASTVTVEKTVSGTSTTITGTTAAPPVAGAGVVQAQAVAGPVSEVCVIDANAAVPAGATISVTTGAATVTKVVLKCIGTAQALTVS